MSHFSCMVIGDNVEEQLQPFHEFECTGTDDKYVQTIDVTKDKLAEYKESSTTRLKTPDGKLMDPWDELFFREPTAEEKRIIGPMAGSGCGGGLVWSSRGWGDGKGYRTRVKFIPAKYKEVEVKTSRVMTFREYLARDGVKFVEHGEMPDLEEAHKYGYATLKKNGTVATVVDRTNPNRKWDYWTTDGRYSGRLRLYNGQLVNQARIQEIDFHGMRGIARMKAEVEYDKVAELFGGTIKPLEFPWARLIDNQRFEDLSIEMKRAAYHAQPPLAKMHDLSRLRRDDKEAWEKLTKVQQEFVFWGKYEDYTVGREAFAIRAQYEAVSTFAVVKDRKWYERGSMGMFGMVTGEQDEVSWAREINNLICSSPDHTLITIVDCHI